MKSRRKASTPHKPNKEFADALLRLNADAKLAGCRKPEEIQSFMMGYIIGFEDGACKRPFGGNKRKRS
jgi:hypothetical protein